MSATPLIRFRISPEGGDPFVVACMSRDVLMWERTGRTNSYADLMQKQDMAPMYALAHLASRRLGLFVGDLAAFEATCDLEPIGDDDEVEAAADPTRPARSTVRRSRSR